MLDDEDEDTETIEDGEAAAAPDGDADEGVDDDILFSNDTWVQVRSMPLALLTGAMVIAVLLRVVFQALDTALLCVRQCDRKNCLKWRKLPAGVTTDDLDEQSEWYCGEDSSTQEKCCQCSALHVVQVLAVTALPLLQR